MLAVHWPVVAGSNVSSSSDPFSVGLTVPPHSLRERLPSCIRRFSSQRASTQFTAPLTHIVTGQLTTISILLCTHHMTTANSPMAFLSILFLCKDTMKTPETVDIHSMQIYLLHFNKQTELPQTHQLTTGDSQSNRQLNLSFIWLSSYTAFWAVSVGHIHAHSYLMFVTSLDGPELVIFLLLTVLSSSFS